jgi:hypothetical protein
MLDAVFLGNPGNDRHAQLVAESPIRRSFAKRASKERRDTAGGRFGCQVQPFERHRDTEAESLRVTSKSILDAIVGMFRYLNDLAARRR